MSNLNTNMTITDSELLSKNIPTPKYHIPNLLPESGLMVIAGAPKMGKSIIMTDLGLSVASGGKFLFCYDVKPSHVLYLALEDSEQRMKNKIEKMAFDCPPSDRIHFAFNWDNQSPGALNNLNVWLNSHNEVKVVIIDTISRFSVEYSTSQYSKGYEKFAELKKIADSRNLLIIIVHHIKKSKSDDPYMMLYGSNAMTGAADIVWILERQRGNSFSTLHVSGRDIPDQSLSLRFDETLVGWTVIDDANTYNLAKDAFRVYHVLRENGCAMSLEKISKATGYKKPVLSKYLKKLIALHKIERVGYGLYCVKGGQNNANRNSQTRYNNLIK